MQLMVMDVSSKKIDSIPSLSSSENSVPPDSECGIHRDHDTGKLFRNFEILFAVLFSGSSLGLCDIMLVEY
jgi:hypothetical protein